MKSKYLDKQEYYVDSFWFRHKGVAFQGSGVLTWSPENGFHLMAKIFEGNRPNIVEARSIEIAKPLRIMLKISTTWGKTIAMTPNLYLRDSDLHFNRSLTINFGRAVFFHHSNAENESMRENWFGSAIFEVNQSLIFPDAIHKDVKLGDKPFGESFSRTGFYYLGNNKEDISGEIEENKYIHLNWSLPKANWSKGKSWQFAEALQDALSITSGSIARLRFHEAYRGHRIAKEYNANETPISLGLIFRFFDFDILPKEVVGSLAFFLAEKTEREFIIRKMFWQTVDASKQNSDGGRALLLSTVLEASLRTLYKLPYVPNRPSHKDPFKIQEKLKQFQVDYLSGKYELKWKKKIEEIIEAYKHLRHRYAHPDWVTTQDGMQSDLEIEQSINDMIMLSRFYGHMILALSGIKDLEPKFPVPFSNWKPIMTMERMSEKVKEEENG